MNAAHRDKHNTWSVANDDLGRIVRFCKAHNKLDLGTIHGSGLREVLTHIGKGVLLLLVIFLFVRRPSQTNGMVAVGDQSHRTTTNRKVPCRS